MDGRRHSVDIPISRTLLALRRVRSLRDPSTNSMSKFPSLIDNLNWETNSSDGITLGFVNGCDDGGVDNNRTSGLKNLGYQQREESVGDIELHYSLRKPKSMLISGENAGSVQITKEVVGSYDCRSNQEMVCGNELFYERNFSDYRENGWDLTCITPSSDQLEGVGSCNEPIEASLQAEKLSPNASKQKSRYKRQIRVYRTEAACDIMSRVGSPCLSASDAPLEGSSCGASLYGKEDVAIVDGNDRGCGISCCWSRTPKFRERNLQSDVEDEPLLSGEVGETLLSGHGKSWKHINQNSYSESPRSLSQKFRPKSFNELVGQNGVVRSLLSAISNGKIAPFYLFHGPRGTGKTSASRIFAAALNCLSLHEDRPCVVCRECVMFFSGRSKDVKEVDSVRINRTNGIRSLLKNAAIPPVSSRFKVFIIDDCHLLRGETWATFFNNIDNLSPHVVFIMITPDLDKLPRSAVTLSLRYQFPKIKEADIASRLGKICMEEGLDFDQVALDFVANKSNGSLRDAEMMLEQLSLLGRRITMSLVYELIGIVAEDELIELLDLALSSDTSNTIRRARELLRTRIDPMQLTSQLANLIMDILAGKCQEGSSEIRRKFLGRLTSETEMQQLGHALKILSEAEKQLRTSKNQTTWLTVALLQLSSVGSSFLDANESGLSVRTVHPRDGEFVSTTSTGESLKHLVTCACDSNELHKIEMHDGKETLESIWKRATEMCQSTSLENFLKKQGKLSSVCFDHGLAVVELEFHHPDYVAKAEKSWKSIASSLQSILGCNVEIRINLATCTSLTKYAKVKKPSFSLFSCSRRMHHKSQPTTERGSDPSDKSDFTSKKVMVGDKFVESCSSDCGSQVSLKCYHRKEVSRTIRSSEGNALSISIGTEAPHRVLPADFPKDKLLVDSLKEDGSESRGCFLRTFKLHKKLRSSDSSQMICLRSQPQNNLALSIPRRTSETYFNASEPHVYCNSSNNDNCCYRNQVRPREDTKVHCWRTPTFPFRKAWQLRYRQRRTHLAKWVLPCAAGM